VRVDVLGCLLVEPRVAESVCASKCCLPPARKMGVRWWLTRDVRWSCQLPKSPSTGRRNKHVPAASHREGIVCL